MHTYEELRSAVLDVLKGNYKRLSPTVDLNGLIFNVNSILRERKTEPDEYSVSRSPVVIPGDSELDNEDKANIKEVFYDLFRQGVISPGRGEQYSFPYFELTRFGRELIESDEQYFFYDVSSYEEHILSEIPNINPDTMIYLRESMQAFRAGCYFSSNVMVGVATEHTFLLLLETVAESAAWGSKFQPAFKERDLANKVDKFQNILLSGVSDFPKDLKSDLVTQFTASLTCIRNYRNQAGHPTGFRPSREKSYIAMQLFIPSGRKIYQIRSWFENYTSS